MTALLRLMGGILSVICAGIVAIAIWMYIAKPDITLVNCKGTNSTVAKCYMRLDEYCSEAGTQYIDLIDQMGYYIVIK